MKRSEAPARRAGPFDKTHGPEHAEGLPGKVLSFILCHIVPLDPVYPAHGGTGLAVHVPVNKEGDL